MWQGSRDHAEQRVGARSWCLARLGKLEAGTVISELHRQLSRAPATWPPGPPPHSSHSHLVLHSYMLHVTCYTLHVTCDDWARCSDCYHITTELLTGEMCRTDNCCWSWLIVMDHVRTSRLGTQTGNIPSSGSQRRPGGDRRVQFADKI